MKDKRENVEKLRCVWGRGGVSWNLRAAVLLTLREGLRNKKPLRSLCLLHLISALPAPALVFTFSLQVHFCCSFILVTSYGFHMALTFTYYIQFKVPA